MNIKEDDILIQVVGVNDEEGKSPSVDDFFNERKYYDFYEFIQDCEELSESQNGYFSIRDANETTFTAEFYTFDDTDDVDGIRTGFVLFTTLIKPNKAILSMFND